MAEGGPLPVNVQNLRGPEAFLPSSSFLPSSNSSSLLIRSFHRNAHFIRTNLHAHFSPYPYRPSVHFGRGWIDGSMDRCMHECNGSMHRMDRWIDSCMDAMNRCIGWIDRFMHGCNGSMHRLDRSIHAWMQWIDASDGWIDRFMHGCNGSMDQMDGWIDSRMDAMDRCIG
jgi:hypothetical protein